MKTLPTLFLAALFVCLPLYAWAKLNVVVSFSILADMTHMIADDQINLTMIVPPGSDTHVYEPTPQDTMHLAHADLVIVNGLNFESWMDRLIASSGFKGTLVVATSGITPITLPEGGFDPHAWQDLNNGKIYAANIRDALMKADSKNASYYSRNAALYINQLSLLDNWVRAEIATVPKDKREGIINHNSLRYFTRSYGVTFLSPLGVSTAGDPSAGEIARLIDTIRQSHLHAIFLENMSDPRLMRQIGSDSGARIAGTLYSDTLSGPGGEAPSYMALFRHNVTVMTKALKQ